MKAKEITKEYDIVFDPKAIVPTDDTLIDDAWRAGMDLATEVGILCTDAKRIIKFDEEELKNALKNLPDETTLGEGKDKVIVTPRNLEDKKTPMIFSRALGPISEGTLPVIYESFVQSRIDIFNPQGTVTLVEGSQVKIGSLFEVCSELNNVLTAWIVPRKKVGQECRSLEGQRHQP